MTADVEIRVRQALRRADAAAPPPPDLWPGVQRRVRRRRAVALTAAAGVAVVVLVLCATAIPSMNATRVALDGASAADDIATLQRRPNLVDRLYDRFVPGAEMTLVFFGYQRCDRYLGYSRPAVDTPREAVLAVLAGPSEAERDGGAISLFDGRDLTDAVLDVRVEGRTAVVDFADFTASVPEFAQPCNAELFVRQLQLTLIHTPGPDGGRIRGGRFLMNGSARAFRGALGLDRREWRERFGPNGA